ncbi:uncharacterized protein [Diabrotica undecimpunctata]|uniref:uncharacterized protein n=1 Tax=Diabrotica undecimpunctata TaxID=50387 RepID=UPI003B634FD0
MSLDPDATIKALGIQWNSRENTLFYSSGISSIDTLTNRSMLSQITKLFDPLKLLGSVIVYAKIIMQICWKSGVTWDELLPLEIRDLWLSFQAQLKLIKHLKFSRCIIIPNPVDIQIHGFCDASEKDYGACLYCRSVDAEENIFVRLICAKSRVAPISSISLPRLELCDALLLARLYATLQHFLLLEINGTYFWPDSIITLHWINTQPYLLRTFVVNRVGEIQRLTSQCHWQHVSSLDNPSDFLSRGQLPSEFLENIGKLVRLGYLKPSLHGQTGFWI